MTHKTLIVIDEEDNLTAKLNRDAVRKIALETGFKLKPQDDREDDLHDYVYKFAEKLALQIRKEELLGLMKQQNLEALEVGFEELKGKIYDDRLQCAIEQDDNDVVEEIASDAFTFATQAYCEARLKQLNKEIAKDKDL